MNWVTQQPFQLLGPATVLVFAVLSFLLYFLPFAAFRSQRLKRAISSLRKERSADKEILGTIFHRDPILSGAWREFKDTLHQPKELDATGTWRPGPKVWSTVPAEMFFSERMPYERKGQRTNP
jgi:hypothetical protein